VAPQFGLWELVVAVGGFFGALTLLGLVNKQAKHEDRLNDLPGTYVQKSDYHREASALREDVRALMEKMDRLIENLNRENNR